MEPLAISTTTTTITTTTAAAAAAAAKVQFLLARSLWLLAPDTKKCSYSTATSYRKMKCFINTKLRR